MAFHLDIHTAGKFAIEADGLDKKVAEKVVRSECDSERVTSTGEFDD